METKHTPGPWKIINWDSSAQIRDSNNNEVALLRNSSNNSKEIALPDDKTIANAKLIAAAPDQNEALINCPDPYQYETIKEFIEEYDKWNESKRKPAIKKATE